MTNSGVTRARLIGLLVVLTVFGAGFAAGAAWNRSRPRTVTMTVEARRAIPDDLMRLGLSEEQTRRIRTILDDRGDRAVTILNEVTPRLRAAMDTLNSEVRAVLTPAQRVALDASGRHQSPFEIRIKRKGESGVETVDTLEPAPRPAPKP
ncbi:MAG: hypothetical protein ABI647_09060 [Gemmatimonadota bacterium]